jgi:hypothetical protein
MARLMRSNRVTLYNSLGEVDRREAYKRTVLDARIERGSGQDSGKVTLFVPSTSGYVVPEAFAGTGFTFAEGDLIAVGESAIEIPTGTVAQLEAAFEVLRVTGHEAIELFGRTHHFEVSCA